MSIVRKIKLNKLGCYQIKDNEKELFQFIERHFFNLKCLKITNENNVNISYLNKYDRHIGYYDINTKGFYINYFLIWSVLIHKFGYTTSEISEFILNMLKHINGIKNNKIEYCTWKYFI